MWAVGPSRAGAESGWDEVEVAAEGDQRLRRDDLGESTRPERDRRRLDQLFGCGQAGATGAFAVVDRRPLSSLAASQSSPACASVTVTSRPSVRHQFARPSG
jgi:hypothetical protein